MKPTPRKLALLMAVAGLGLSLGQAAQAKRDAPAHAGGLGWMAGESNGRQGASAIEGWGSLPDGPLDATLTSADVAPAPSEEDRAAVALAMVLMADAPSAGPTTLPIPGFATSLRWQPSADFRRDFGPGERTAEAASANAPVVPAVAAERGDAQTQVALVSAAVAPASPALDLDLTAPAGVDVNLELPSVLDLDLSLSPGLDLNLDLSPSIDLPLDRPPVFPTTRLRPLGAATKQSVTALPEQAVSSPGRPAPKAAMAAVATAAAMPASAAAPAPAAAPVTVAREPAASNSLGTAVPAVAKQVRAAEPLPTIVVASHADRVLFSLEALLANDDPMAGGFGARTEEVIVSSHAEKALATLAAICRRGDAELADLHVAQAPASPAGAETATPVATVARKPSARQETSPRPARSSALGDDLVAVNEGSLDKIRGGFDTGNGLQISFGIERAVYINGSLVTTTSLNVSDLGKVVGGQAAVSAAVAGARNLTLIQNGSGNTFVTGPVSAAAVGTVIQNTLNDQKIQAVTSINATVNSLQMMKAQNFESSMRGALTDALRR